MYNYNSHSKLLLQLQVFVFVSEMSVEESYSKSSVSTMSSSTMESSSSMSSTMIAESLTSGDSGIAALTSKLDTDLMLADATKDLSQGNCFFCGFQSNSTTEMNLFM